MKTTCETRYAVGVKEVQKMDTKALRKNFLIKKVLRENQIKWVYSHFDRYMTSGVIPKNESIVLETVDALKSNYFLERRELGIINIGSTGKVSVDGTEYILQHKEALYIGRGNKEVVFSSEDSENPAKFYLNSTPAHHSYPVKKVSQNDAEVVELGDSKTANARTIRKLIVNSVVETCQLQMGMTELKAEAFGILCLHTATTEEWKFIFILNWTKIKQFHILWDYHKKPDTFGCLMNKR